MPVSHSFDVKIAGHTLRGVSVHWGLHLDEGARADAPAYGMHIEAPAVVELLGLVASGTVTPEKVQALLHAIARRARETNDRDYEAMLEAMEATTQSSRRVVEPDPQPDPRWVYAVSSEDRPRTVKIGLTKQIQSRMKSLQTGSASPLSLRWYGRGGALLEQHLHSHFAGIRVSGEWFDFSAVEDPVELIAAEAVAFLQQFTEFDPGRE
jgi:hypothetical protein